MENDRILTPIMPYDEDLEKLILGTIISNKFGYDEIRDIISLDSFYVPFHQNIYQIFKDIEKKGEEPHVVNIGREYHKKYGEIKLVEISNLGEIYSLSNIYSDCCELNNLSTRRKLLELGIYLQSKSSAGQDDVSDIISSVNDRLETLYKSSENSVFTIKEAIKGVYDIIDRNASNTNQLTGTPTGLTEFDKRAGGLQTSDLVIIAAETSQGKTSLALSIANHAAINGEPIAIYSLEMKKEQCAARLMAINSGIPANELLYSRISSQTFEQLDQSISSIYNSKIYFDDRSTSNIDLIINSIRSMVLKYKIKGVIIDYLQILNVNMKGANKEQQMADVARRLKNLAKDLDIWIIALSQLNRDNQNPVPNLNRLRDSGQIAEAADTVIFIYRPEIYNKPFPEPFEKYDTRGYAMIDVAKGRNIGIFKMLCQFQKETTHFIYQDKGLVPLSTSSIISDDNPF